MKTASRKTWNAKYTLRSHFDGVRALAFHPTESILITASEDHTMKLWNLQKTVTPKKYYFYKLNIILMMMVFSINLFLNKNLLFTDQRHWM